MKLILHVGTHKTGTTAIQSFLSANVDIIEGWGIRFPLFEVRWPQLVNPGRNGYFLNREALHRLGVDSQVDDRRQVATCTDAIAKAMEGGGSGQAVLLSDERMWYSGSMHAGYWEAVKNAARNIGFDEFEVIIYVRRQDEFAESLWNQFVKATKKTESLEEFLRSPRVRSACDYYAGVKRIERVFGVDSVRVAIYDRGRLKNGDAVDDFCYRIGLPLGIDYRHVPDEQANPRLSNNLVELKRIMNRSVEYQELNNLFGRAFAHAMLADDWSEESSMIGDDARHEFLAQFKRGNKLLAKERFAGQELFRRPKATELPVWEFDSEAMLRDTVVVMADLLCEQEKRIRRLESCIDQLPRPSREASRPGTARNA